MRKGATLILKHGQASLTHPATLLELLPAATGARVIPADFRVFAADGFGAAFCCPKTVDVDDSLR